MWNSRTDTELEREKPGIFQRIGAAWNAARGLLATRVEIFKAEAAAKGQAFAGGAIFVAAALAFAWLALLLLTALVVVLFARLLGSVWAGLLAAFVLYGLLAGGAAFAGIKKFKSFRPFEFPETSRGVKEDWETVRAALRTPAESEDGTDVEQRFRAGSE